jgi:hypothetical protein
LVKAERFPMDGWNLRPLNMVFVSGSL